MRFINAYTANLHCSPTRTSIFIGQYPDLLRPITRNRVAFFFENDWIRASLPYRSTTAWF